MIVRNVKNETQKLKGDMRFSHEYAQKITITKESYFYVPGNPSISKSYLGDEYIANEGKGKIVYGGGQAAPGLIKSKTDTNFSFSCGGDPHTTEVNDSLQIYGIVYRRVLNISCDYDSYFTPGIGLIAMLNNKKQFQGFVYSIAKTYFYLIKYQY